MVTISDQSWGRKSDAAQNLKLHARFQASVTEGSTSKKGNTKFRPNWALARLLTRRGKFFGKAQPTNVCPKGVIPYVPPLPRFAAAVNSPTLPVLPSHKPPYKSYAEVVRRGVKAMEDRGKTGFSGYGAGRALGHNEGDRMELRLGQVQGNNAGFGQGSGPFQPATMLGGNCQQIAPNFGGSFFGQGNLVFGQRLQGSQLGFNHGFGGSTGGNRDLSWTHGRDHRARSTHAPRAGKFSANKHVVRVGNWRILCNTRGSAPIK